MTTASLELCKELYEISGWIPERVSCGIWEAGSTLNRGHVLLLSPGDIPAYDLGFLLRKLPPYYVVYRGIECCHVGIIAGRNFISNRGIDIEADTPENALCKLAIELFKQGVLKPESEG